MAGATPDDHFSGPPIGVVRLIPRRDLRTPLPRFLTPFIGREREVAAVCSLLLRSDVPLVTLTGAAGVGKTRLAVRAAAEVGEAFAHGAAFVPLAAVHDPDLVLPTVAATFGVRQGTERALVDRLAALLADSAFLLVLDNLEQVPAAAGHVAALLVACPRLTVLATSRAPLRVSGEHTFVVPPLALPTMATRTAGSPPLAEIARAEAVRLFIERAEAARADFVLTDANAEAVVAICRKLDGLPLAIELAAARLGALPPVALLTQLERRLPLLGQGPQDAPVRLQTMRNAIGWSYALLGAEEQRLFRQLSIFAGGFTLAAAEWVMGDGSWVMGEREDGGRRTEDGSDPAAATRSPTPDPRHPSPITHHPSPTTLDGIASLVDKSLLRQTGEPHGEPRFRMLNVIREFGLERLEASGEADAAYDRLLGWYLTHARRAGWRWDVPTDHGDREWFASWELEHANVRAVLAWAEARGEVERGLQLASALFLFWWAGTRVDEGRGWLERGLAHPTGVSPAARAQALAVLSAIAHRRDDNVRAAQLALDAAALWAQIGDWDGNGQALYLLAIALYRQGDLDAAEQSYSESLAHLRAAGNDVLSAEALLGLAQIARDRGDLARAASLFEEVLQGQLRDEVNWGAALSRYGYGTVVQEQGDLARALALYRESLFYWQQIGDEGSVAVCLEAIASALCASGLASRAARLLGAAQGLREAIDAPIPCNALASYGGLVRSVRDCLGHDAFAEAWLAGLRLSSAEAVAEAFSPHAAPAREARPVTAPGLAPPSSPTLTPREWEVLKLVAAGHSDRQIAETLFISRRTASEHVGNILQKLGARSRSDAAAIAVRLGRA